MSQSQPLWKEFYTKNAENLSMVEIRPNRNLCILNIPSLIKQPNYAFFIHGQNARMGQFDEQISHFKSKNYNIVAFDRIGCGNSSKPKNESAYHITEIFADLCSIFKTYLPQSSSLTNDINPIIIISHSFGTFQAIRLCYKYLLNSNTYGYDIRGIVLIGCMPFLNTDKLKMGFIGNTLFKLPYSIIDSMQNILTNGFIASAFHKNSSQQLKAMEVEASNSNPSYMFVSTILNGQKYINQHNIKNIFHDVISHGVNICVIHGESDGLCKYEYVQNVCKYIQKNNGNNKILSSHLIDTASHQVMQESPKLTNLFITNFCLRIITK